MTSTTDRGWSWMILAASFVSCTLIFGTVAGGGVLYVAILDTFENSTRSEVIWIPFLMQCCLNIMGPVAGYLGQRYTYRKIVIIGGLIASLGLVTCFFASTTKHLFASFGIVYGLGIGLVVTPNVVVVNLAFDKYRGLANGISTAGASVGSFLGPPVMEILFESYGLRGLYLIWGGVMLHIILAGAVFRPVKKSAKDIEIDFLKDNTKINKNHNPRDPLIRHNHRLASFSFLATRYFWFTALGWTGVAFGISCYAVILVDFAMAQDAGISRYKAAFLMSFWAIGDLIGRIVCGVMLDKKLIKLKYCYIFSMVLSAVAATCIQFLNTYTSIAICSFFFGLALGSAFVQHSLLLIETLGLETFQKAFGYLSVTAGINMIGLTLLVGFLRDYTLSQNANFTLIGFLLLLPAILWVSDITYKLCKKKNKDSRSCAYDIASNEIHI